MNIIINHIRSFNRRRLTRRHLKKTLVGARLWRPKRIYRRYMLAQSYYRPQLKMIKSWAFKDTEYSNFYYDLKILNIEHMTHAISVITNLEHKIIARYIEEIRTDDWLKKLILKNLKSSDYPKDTKVEFARRIGWYAIARAIKPKVIVETGVHNGVGACVLTRALMKNSEEGILGEYFGTDIDESAGQLLTSPLSDYGKILYGDSITSLGKLNYTIDLFINDSDHSETYEQQEYEIVNEKLSSNAIILGDNSHVTDKLSKFSLKTNRKFIFIPEKPKDHWYPGAGIGVSYIHPQN
jgi:predicted O-methyltransferase YrrM